MGAPGLRGKRHPRQRQRPLPFPRLVQAVNDPVARTRRFAVPDTDRHARETGRVFGDRRLHDPLVFRQMAAQQRRIDLTHRALAELLAQRSVNPLVAGDHHQTGSAEVKAVYQGTARKALDQSMMDRVEVARIFA